MTPGPVSNLSEPIPVVAAVVVRDGRALLCQRRDGPHLPRMWEFPGGKVRPGETPRAALARELHEELGVPARVGNLLAEVRHTYPDKRVWLRFYSAELQGDPRPLVHRQLRWIPAGELEAYSVPPANAPVVAALAAGELRVEFAGSGPAASDEARGARGGTGD